MRTHNIAGLVASLVVLLGCGPTDGAAGDRLNAIPDQFDMEKVNAVNASDTDATLQSIRAAAECGPETGTWEFTPAESFLSLTRISGEVSSARSNVPVTELIGTPLEEVPISLTIEVGSEPVEVEVHANSSILPGLFAGLEDKSIAVSAAIGPYFEGDIDRLLLAALVWNNEVAVAGQCMTSSILAPLVDIHGDRLGDVILAAGLKTGSEFSRLLFPKAEEISEPSELPTQIVPGLAGDELLERDDLTETQLFLDWPESWGRDGTICVATDAAIGECVDLGLRTKTQDRPFSVYGKVDEEIVVQLLDTDGTRVISTVRTKAKIVAPTDSFPDSIPTFVLTLSGTLSPDGLGISSSVVNCDGNKHVAPERPRDLCE